MYRKFYHQTIKRNIAVFATLFDGIHIDLANNKEVRVPIHYAPKEKFIEVATRRPDIHNVIVDVQLPVMGFELISLNFAPERATNKLQRITANAVKPDGTRDYMYNRVPYDLQFELYVATTRLEDGHKIVEQILPFFAPELTVAIKAVEGMVEDSNVTVVLTSVSPSIEYESGLSDKRVILWQLSFTVKTHLYSDIKSQRVIDTAILELGTDENLDYYFAEITDRFVVTQP